MSRIVFLAGGSGVVGLRLIPLLVEDGWRVVATTRTPSRADSIRLLGAQPVVVDVFDAEALANAVRGARPGVVVHQLTSLPDGLAPAKMAEAPPRNARIRDEGTRNLVAAATAAGATRMVAQSISFAYAAGRKPHSEDDPIDPQALGVLSLERQVLTAPFQGLVLRYGRFYGPGTGFDRGASPGSLHVDDAAEAARVAVRLGAPDVYNVAEDDGDVTVERAKRELGFHARPR